MVSTLIRSTVAIAIALAVPAPALAASTARAALSEVMAAAKKWQPDAVLTYVNTLNGKSDGTAREWSYTVYSPKAKKSASITTRDLKVVEVLELLRNIGTDPLPGEYLDSDKAIEAARKAGLKTDARDVALTLTTLNQATGKPWVAWSVLVSTADGFSSVILNSRDGTVLKREDVKLK